MELRTADERKEELADIVKQIAQLQVRLAQLGSAITRPSVDVQPFRDSVQWLGRAHELLKNFHLRVH